MNHAEDEKRVRALLAQADRDLGAESFILRSVCVMALDDPARGEMLLQAQDLHGMAQARLAEALRVIPARGRA